MTAKEFWRCVVTSGLVAIAIWVPLRMQDIMVPHNEGCFGPFADADYRALVTIRYQTWAISFVATGLCLLALWRLNPNRRVWIALGATFAVWKIATFYFDTFGSPICWEPYANDSPFWDEPPLTGLAFFAQPLAFIALALGLIGLAVWKWLALVVEITKKRPARGN